MDFISNNEFNRSFEREKCVMRGKKLGKDLLKSIKRDDLVGFLAEKTSMWGGKDIRNR